MSGPDPHAAIVRLLESERVVAIVRNGTATAGELAATASSLAESGFHLVEFPLTSKGALEAIELVSAGGGASVVGAGTVTTVEEVDRVADAGASFIVTPAFDQRVLRRAHERGLATLPGALTPTEISAAVDAGATAVKIFPAGPLGPEYIAALLAPYPRLRAVPTGGIAVDRVAEYLAAGATAVGLGSDLVGDGSTEQIRARAGALREQLERVG
ncbi:MAG: bifunctional 4-hydroxy-2-oxoglutarate aldolase/2-dehydro-3-deoxy-phosphogluconate aldolase [Microbacterium sp.]